MPEKNGTRPGHVDRLTDAVREALTVRRAFGEPIVHGNVAVIPVARVTGGHGMGYGSGDLDARRSGSSADASEPSTEGGGTGEGGGGGFGVRVRPIGVFVVTDDDAEWQPTLDVTRIVLASQAFAAVAVIAAAEVIRYRIAHGAAPVVQPAPVAVRLAGILPRIPRPRLVRRSVVGTANLVSAMLSRRP